MHTQTTILIVDAARASLQITRQLLESNGYKTCGAGSGRAALSLVSNEHPELVLINSQLPDMDGFEICRQIKALPELAGVFVVIMLGDQLGTEDQPSVSEPGADGYIVRPISEQALLSRVQAMLYERSAIAAVRHKEELLGQRLDELAALNALGQQINLALPLDVILPMAIDEVITAIQPDQVFIFLLKDGKLLLEAGRDVRNADFFQHFPEHRIGECLCGLALREGRSLYSRDILNDMRCTWLECKRAGLRSFAALPLQAGQETFGVLGLASLTERDFEQQAVFLQILAAQVSLGIQNARLYESVQNKLNEQQRLDEVIQDKNKILAALQETTLELISERDLQVLLENIVKRAGQLVGTESGFLYLIEAGAEQLKPKIALGALVGSIQIGPRKGEGVAGLVWQTSQPQVIDDYDTWVGRIANFPNGKIRALAGVPLLSGDNVLGVLGLAYDQPSTRVFGPEALELLMQFARLASIAIQNARLFSALQQELLERGRAEQALRSSEERFRLAFNTSPDSININRLVDGLYVDINEGFTRITGYTRADAIGKTSMEINIWNDLADRARLVQGLHESGEVKNLEAQFRKKDGSLMTGLMSARIIMLDDVQHILTITRDIEEKKQIENALRASEKKFRNVVEFSPTAMHFYHLESYERLVLIDANPAADRILGVMHQVLIGKTIEEAFPNLVESEYPEMYRKVARGELGSLAFELQYDDNRLGGYFDVHVYQTDPDFILVDFIDISERKHTEQALREREFWLSESQRVGRIGSYSMDLARDIWVSSSVLDDIFGIEPSFEKSTSSWTNLVHPDEREAMLDYFNHFVIGERQPFDKEYRILRANNAEERWVWGRGELLLDKHGTPVQMIGTIQDVTERRQAEEQIKKLNTQLEQRVAERTAQLQMTNKELEAFAYSVSHDLRAPLRGIDGWSLALQEDYGDRLDAQGHKYLERVRAETQRMGQLIDDLLQLSRITRAEIQFMPVDLTALAYGITARLLEEQPGHRLEFSIQPDLMAQGDSHLLEIALTNLFSNACKFSSTRPVSQIVFGQTLQNGKLAYFVRDNGVGFDMIYAKNLFGAFQRMHKQSEFPGTGIGLATVQRIIHRHGGMIWADSSPDMGAVFYFTLETAV